MTSAHFFYIPVMILVGLVLGFILGRQAGIGFAEQELARSTRRDERRRAREAAKTQALAEEDGDASGSPQ